MANPQPNDAHLRLAHSILEQLMISDFSKLQMKMLLFILRLGWGTRGNSNKKDAVIRTQKTFEIVGVPESNIKANLQWLVEAKVIFVDGDRYRFNKDFDQWRVSRAQGFSNEKLAGEIHFNLNYYSHSKVGFPDADILAEGNGIPSIDDMPILEVWQSVDGFNVSEEKQLELLAKLKAEKSLNRIDLLEQSKQWAAYKLDKPLLPKSNASSQIWKWMVKAVGYENGQESGNKQQKERWDEI